MAAKEADLNLPKVTNPMPAIFVPLDKDLTKPIEGRQDRIDRVKKMIESIDYYTAGVKRGIIHLTEMDRRRILAEHQRHQQMFGPTPPVPNMSAAEADHMIAGMNAPPVDGVNYNLPDAELMPNFRRHEDKSDGEDTLRQLQLLVEDGISNITGYEKAMAAVRKRWTDILEKEERKMNEKFGQAPTANMDMDGGGEDVPMDLD